MSYVFLPPERDVSLFTKGKKVKRKQPEFPWLLKLALFLYAAAIAPSFGYVAAKFGDIAFHHQSDPHAMVGMMVAFVLSTIALVAAAVAGKTGLNLLGMS